MADKNLFFFPITELYTIRQFLKETYPDNTPNHMRVTEAIAKKIIPENRIPKQIARKLFNTTNPFKLSDKNMMGVIFTDDPKLSVKLKKWWFGEKHLAYAKTELKKMIDGMRFEKAAEEEIKNTCYATSYPIPLNYDGTPIV